MAKYSIFLDLGLIFGHITILIKYLLQCTEKEKEKLKAKGFIVFKTVPTSG